MRELEFLPDWYPQMRQRTRMVVLQAWMTVAMAIGMCLWMFLMHSNVRRARENLDDVAGQVKQSRIEMKQLGYLSNKAAVLREQDQLMVKLGLQVEPSRLMKTIDSAMSREMSVLGMQMEVVERLEGPTAQSVRLNTPAPLIADRHLQVKLQGVAPTDVDLANFATRLGEIPFLEQVAINYARERSENGHVMREFEISFSMSLNHTVGTAPDALLTVTDP